MRDPNKRAASIQRYLSKRYRNDPAFRLKRINNARVRQGYEPLDSLDEAKTTMKVEPDQYTADGELTAPGWPK